MSEPMHNKDIHLHRVADKFKLQRNKLESATLIQEKPIKYPYLGEQTSRQRIMSTSCARLVLISATLILITIIAPSWTDASGSMGNKLASRVAEKLQLSGTNLARKFELATSNDQINKWLVRQVAPAVAGKLIDSVLQTPKSAKKSAKSNDDSSSSKSTAIDTQALADKIVDKLADSVKKRKSSPEHSTGIAGEQETGGSQRASSNRKGKSLVGDLMQQGMQNLLSRDNRNLFGRAMERSKLPFRGASFSSSYSSSPVHNSSAWVAPREPQYESPVYASTENNHLLDENPVILRAEHGHNLTTMTTPVNEHHMQNLSPLISSLMSNTAGSNQINNGPAQKHRTQQKYVHSNRHQQQPGPKPLLANQRRHQQQSPYSLSVTSDVNVVQAPSSPAPPPLVAVTTLPSTTTSSSTMLIPFAFSQTGNRHSQSASVSAPTIQQLGLNKFKVNTRQQQQQAAAAPFQYGSSRNSAHNQQAQVSNRRYQHHHPSTTSTTSTTTTTTSTTTTPEPSTENPLTDTLESLLDLDQQTSSPVSSILNSVAQSALDSFTSLSSNMASDDNTNTIYTPTHSNSTSQSSQRSHSSTSSSSGSIKSASPSTTSARHSIISAEAIPTALGAPLYHLTRANFTATSIMAPPPRRSSASPATKMAVQYLQKGLTNLSSNIFSRQSKNWARRLGLSSVLLSSLLYGAAILANPGAPLPTSGLQGKFHKITTTNS